MIERVDGLERAVEEGATSTIYHFGFTGDGDQPIRCIIGSNTTLPRASNSVHIASGFPAPSRFGFAVGQTIISFTTQCLTRGGG